MLRYRIDAIVSSISSRCNAQRRVQQFSDAIEGVCALTSAALVESYAVIADSQKWPNCAITIVNELAILRSSVTGRGAPAPVMFRGFGWMSR